MIALLALLAFAAQDESRYYAVDYLVPPDGAVLEVGGMDFLSDGRLVVSTRRGQVWLVEDPLNEDPLDAHFQLFVEGLQEGLGLRVVDDVIHVVQRGEVSRLVDVDGDGRCDDVVTVTDGWGVSGNYHEFAYGLPFDAEGNSYVTLNVSFFSPKWWHGKSPVPYRGWALRITPDGAVEPVASGFRSPCGVSLSPEGELFITDNQGDWMPASPIFRVRDGGFYGHPASLDWTEEYRTTQTLASDTIPPARASEREPAAIWLPYEWSRSPGDLAWDRTEGTFGPFGGQVFVSELTNGMVLRGDFEEHEGVLQGWVTPFRRGVGSVVRVLFAPDGTLLAGFTNRGWGGLSPADGLGRIRWTGEEPFEVLDVELLGRDDANADGGFRVYFTQPLADDWLVRVREEAASGLLVTQHHYDYWWEYGSPEREVTPLRVSSARVEGDTLEFRLTGLEPGHVVKASFLDLANTNGTPLLHDTFAYTLNVLPGAPPGPPIARLVPPPPARESGEEGWLRLTYGDAFDAWNSDGWELVEAELDPEDPTRFRTKKGDSHLTNTGKRTPSTYVSKPHFGDARITFDVTLPKGGIAAVYILGSYGLQLADTETELEGRVGDCGTLLGGEGWSDLAPALSGYRGTGSTNSFDIKFRAARFDEAGRKIENARLERVLLNDVLLHENVELPGASRGATRWKETRTGPLVFAGGPTQYAIGDIRIRTLEEHDEEEGFVPLIDLESDEPLAGWRSTEQDFWYVEDEILVGEGPRSHLFSPRDDYGDFELLLEAKVSDGGNSGVVLRAPFLEEGWPEGLEVELNCSFADARKTGSIGDVGVLKTHLVAPDTWFELRLRCQDERTGTRVTVSLNGVPVNDVHVPRASRPEPGHIALQQHHDGSVVEFRKLLIKEP